MTPETLAPTPYALYDLVAPAATAEGRGLPSPPGLVAARARFAAAAAAYQAGRYAAAADGFLAVARELARGPAPLAAARSAAYHDAACALVLADGPAAARAALDPLLAEDPECAAALREFLAALPG